MSDQPAHEPDQVTPVVAAGCAGFVFGFLPLLGLSAELATGMLSEFHCLFPTMAHKVVVSAAVLANFILHLRHDLVAKWPLLRAALLGLATGMTLLYSVVHARVIGLILAALFLALLGILAAAPFWALLGLPRLWLRAAADRRQHGWRWWLVTLSMTIAPVVWSILHDARVEAPDPSLELYALARRDLTTAPAELEALRGAVHAAPLAPQLAACRTGIWEHEPHIGTDPSQYWFLASAVTPLAIDAIELRAAFHLAHGADWTQFDPARRQTLRWQASQFEVAVEQDAALAVVDWRATVHSTTSTNQEAQFTITLPKGGVADGLSLLLTGEERPAAFGSTERTTRAFETTVRKLRDPALLTEVAPGQLRLRLFPVTASGPPMQVHVRFTLPLELGTEANRLRLPELWCEHASLERPGHDVTVRVGAQELTGVWPDAVLREGMPIVRGTVEQQLVELPTQAPPESVVVVLEASRSVREQVPQLSRLLDCFPNHARCQVCVAVGEGVTTMSGTAADQSLRAWLDALPTFGGVDPRRALREAMQLAKRADRVVYWLHGACARLDNQPSTTLPADVLVLATALSHEVHRLRDSEAFSGQLHNASCGKDANERLRNLAAFVARGADPSGWSINDRRARNWARLTAPPATASGQPAVARLWAAQHARALAAAGADQAASELAARYRLVTAGVGAVVLETGEQYAAEKLSPGAPIGFEPPGSAGSFPVPEPSSLLWFVGGLLVLLSITRKSRPACS